MKTDYLMLSLSILVFIKAQLTKTIYFETLSDVLIPGQSWTVLDSAGQFDSLQRNLGHVTTCRQIK